MIDVTLPGTGGMIPLPGRALTSLYVRCGGKAVLIECGEGTQTAIRVAGLRFMLMPKRHSVRKHSRQAGNAQVSAGHLD